MDRTEELERRIRKLEAELDTLKRLLDWGTYKLGDSMHVGIEIGDTKAEMCIERGDRRLMEFLDES